jgi:transposase-like protein
VKRYPEQQRKAMVQSWVESGQSLRKFSKEQGISISTLYDWKSKYGVQQYGESVLPKSNNPDNWTSEQKFAVVIETATLSETELSEYCRSKGIYPEQVKEWKAACIGSNQTTAQRKQQQIAERKADKKRIRQLEKELKRKEAALAETAALLVLRKKLNAYWGEDEDS